ncbi:MAG: DUF5683 domain-containing protein [Bacteroidota bacterium]
MRKIIPTIFFFLLLPITLLSQEVSPISIDSLVNDTLVPVKKTKRKVSLKQFFKKDYPSPKKAVLLAIAPGMGQIYNKKYWKLPLVYGALGGVIYAIDFNSKNYNRTLLSLEVKSGTSSEMDPFPNTPRSAVESARNSFDKNRQLSWIGLIGFYLISAGDAFVDAHLKDFSVDDNISFRPILETDFNNQPFLGVGIQIPLSK